MDKYEADSSNDAFPEYPEWKKNQSNGVYHTRYEGKFYLITSLAVSIGLYPAHLYESGRIYRLSPEFRSANNNEEDQIVMMRSDSDDRPKNRHLPTLSHVMEHLPEYLMESML